MKAIILGYHSIGCIGIDALIAAGFDIQAVLPIRMIPVRIPGLTQLQSELQFMTYRFCTGEY